MTLTSQVHAAGPSRKGRVVPVTRPLMIGAALSLLVATSAHAAEPVRHWTRVVPLVVVDSTGKVFGRYSNGGVGNAAATAFMSINGSLIGIPLFATADNDHSKLLFSTTYPLYFQDAVCQGVPHASTAAGSADGVKQSVVFYDANGRYLLYVASGPSVAVTAASRLDPGGNCSATNTSLIAWPLAPPIDLTSQYSQPFAIQ